MGADHAPALAALKAGSIAEIAQFFFFNDTATTEIYTLSLHDALPISYGITGGTVGAGVVTKAGAFGTLTVNTSTGAYAFAKNAAAIEALDDTESGADNFTVTVSDGRSEEHTPELQSLRQLVCRLPPETEETSAAVTPI